MKATLENLKTNRLQFIAELTELFGKENLRASMEILKDEVEFAEQYNPDMTIDDVIQCELVGQGLFEETRRKTSDLAEKQGSWMESKGYTSYDHLNKKYI